MSDQPQDLPPGDYAIVELFGHQTMVGRVAEVERFGTKMLALEPLYCGALLPPSLHGGGAIYRLTMCDAATAWREQPKHDWQLPRSIRAALPQPALAAPDAEIDQMADDSDAGDQEFSDG